MYYDGCIKLVKTKIISKNKVKFLIKNTGDARVRVSAVKNTEKNLKGVKDSRKAAKIAEVSENEQVAFGNKEDVVLDMSSSLNVYQSA